MAQAQKHQKTRVVRLPAELLDRVHLVASRERRTFGAQMEKLLEEPLAKAEAQGSAEKSAG